MRPIQALRQWPQLTKARQVRMDGIWRRAKVRFFASLLDPVELVWLTIAGTVATGIHSAEGAAMAVSWGRPIG